MLHRTALLRRSGRLAGALAGRPSSAPAPPAATNPRKRGASALALAAPAATPAEAPAKKRAAAPPPPPRPPKKKAAAAAGPTRDMERALWAKGYDRVAGVDEAGRGPLAGPVVAAACVLPRDFALPPHLKLDDSKKMSEEDREAVYGLLVAHPGVSWAVSAVPASEVDRINILQATMVAMDSAVAKLAEPREEAGPAPVTLPCPVKQPVAFDADTHGGAGPGRSAGPAHYVLVDGPRLPPALAAGDAARPVVKGDARCSAIAAASVLAKVARDRLMRRLDAAWPAYGFAGHKGYGTAGHVAALRAHGPCPQHRRTFAPVKGMV